jgi:ATP-dependent DNA helicase RecG
MSANTVDAYLVAQPADRARLLLLAHEDQWFDRKSALMKPKDLARHLVAFANAEGGTIVVGLHNGRVQGIDGRPEQVNSLRQAPLDFTSPPVRTRFAEVECRDEQDRPNHLLVIRIDPGERVHETHEGECYLRVGDESRHLSYVQRRELEYDRGQAAYDGLPAAGVTVGDLNADLLTDYAQKIGASVEPVEPRRVLAARSLLTVDGKVTNAAFLLFGDEPRILFPQAHVRILRYLGNVRGSGSRQALDEGMDFRIEGPIPRVVEDAQNKIEDLVPRRHALTARGLFESVPIVPRDAWLEGLVNAVVHRSYSLGGDHIRVEIFSDRIEIESPGRFPGLANPNEPLRIARFARNPRVARVCADLRIGQELGEGIRRMFDEMRRVGLTDPIYRQTSGSVRLVLTAMPRLDPAVALRLPDGSQQILDVLLVGGPMGTGDLAEAVGVSRPAVIRRLRALEKVNLIRWVGKSSRDPRAVWKLETPDNVP